MGKSDLPTIVRSWDRDLKTSLIVVRKEGFSYGVIGKALIRSITNRDLSAACSEYISPVILGKRASELFQMRYSFNPREASFVKAYFGRCSQTDYCKENKKICSERETLVEDRIIFVPGNVLRSNKEKSIQGLREGL